MPCCEPDRTPSFNETTIRALEDARAGIGVTEYADAADLFKKMGIEVGKEKKAKP
jgi:antitoxin component of RelBE/YafQ-DinJ toxin-antitoxin module